MANDPFGRENQAAMGRYDESSDLVRDSVAGMERVAKVDEAVFGAKLL